MNIPMYAYYWVMTSAQLELLACDVPIVVYPKRGEKKHTKREMDDLTEKWKKRKAEKEAKGIKIDLNDFLNSGRENNG